jgi:hypothetical protein
MIIPQVIEDCESKEGKQKMYTQAEVIENFCRDTYE